MKKCGECKHYIGGGDWNLCCQLKYGLCYRDTEACEKYEYSEETIRRLEEQDRKFIKYLEELRKEQENEAERRTAAE